MGRRTTLPKRAWRGLVALRDKVMGLPLLSIRLILREHKKEPFTGRILTLGRLAVLATVDRVLDLFAEEKVVPCPLGETDVRTNIPGMRESKGKKSGFTSDLAFFKLLGVDTVETLDISAYENADHIHDLNGPVPGHLADRFDAIFDFGTTEHIFDTREALANISRMLKPGGRVLHLVPATNRIGHGYHMFSPCLFHDYYWANKFVGCEAYLVESSSGIPSFVKWKLFKYEYNSDSSIATSFKSAKAVGVFFVARKTAESSAGRVPNQYQFMDTFFSAGQSSGQVSPATRLRDYVPLTIRKLFFVRWAYNGYQRLATRNGGRGGLKYLGKI